MARINKSEPNHCDSKAYQSNLKMRIGSLTNIYESIKINFGK